jgi:uncharacterized membrane protein
MDPDFEFILLRIVHIVTGSFWVGSAVFLSFILEPQVRALGPAIHRSVMATIGKVAGPVMLSAGTITVIAGIALAFRVRPIENWFVEGDGWGWAIGLGFVVSMAALSFGSMTAKTVKKMSAASESMGDGPPTPEQMAEMQRLGGQIMRFSRIATVLVVIAVASMASARFV